MAQKLRITTNTDLDPSTNVQFEYSTSIMSDKFSVCLYYYDTNKMENEIINIQVNDYTFLNTV